MTLTQPLNPPLRLLASFAALLPDREPLILQAPGRDLWAAAAFFPSGRCQLHALDLKARTAFTRQSALYHQTVLRRPLPRWARYAAGTVLALDHLDVPGVTLLICGDEPPGPRYEYGLGVLVAALWHTLADAPLDERAAIELVDRVGREYVGI